MRCDLCDEHVDPDDYQEHCEQHHNDGEYDERHPRPKFGSQEVAKMPYLDMHDTDGRWEKVEQLNHPKQYNLVSDGGRVIAYSLTEFQADAALAEINRSIEVVRKFWKDSYDTCHDTLKAERIKFQRLSDSETEQWEAYGARLQQVIDDLNQKLQFAKVRDKSLL